MDSQFEQAADLSAVHLLRSAARSVEMALALLDRSTEPTCTHCGSVHYVNPDHARIYKDLRDLPTKLRARATELLRTPSRVLSKGQQP